MRGIFGGMFDLDHDGDLDLVEQALEFQFLDELTREEDDDDEEEDDE